MKVHVVLPTVSASAFLIKILSFVDVIMPNYMIILELPGLVDVGKPSVERWGPKFEFFGHFGFYSTETIILLY